MTADAPLTPLPLAAERPATDEAGRQHLLDLDPPALTGWCEARRLPGFRARQILEWVYQHGVGDFAAMTNLPSAFRGELAASFDIFTSEIVRRAASADGTVKLLLRWPDGAASECVLIPSETRRTGCISSQVGCPVGCRFCASGLDGLQRNLTAGQIVEQVLRVAAEARHAIDAPNKDSKGNYCGTGVSPVRDRDSPMPPSSDLNPKGRGDGRLTNVVFMGLGEPLANYEQVMRAVRTINAPWGPNIGARKITISTVGLPKQIRRLAEEGLQLNLALSLHAPSDGLRAELIPWAERITTADLAAACSYYFQKTGREITLEYVMLAGVNDRPQHADQLAAFARRIRCNVNLLRYNPVEGLPYERPTGEQTHAFQSRLRDRGVNAHVRTSRGLDIDAACGQLRRRESATVPPSNDP